MRIETGPGPMGKVYSLQEDAGPGTTLAALADVVKRSGKSAKDARQELMRLIEQIPDEDLKNFVGAQVSVVT